MARRRRRGGHGQHVTQAWEGLSETGPRVSRKAGAGKGTGQMRGRGHTAVSVFPHESPDGASSSAGWIRGRASHS